MLLNFEQLQVGGREGNKKGVCGDWKKKNHMSKHITLFLQPPCYVHVQLE
jgi:hypothetical protein